jgi:hypothetical protein
MLDASLFLLLEVRSRRFVTANPSFGGSEVGWRNVSEDGGSRIANGGSQKSEERLD